MSCVAPPAQALHQLSASEEPSNDGAGGDFRFREGAAAYAAAAGALPSHRPCVLPPSAAAPSAYKSNVEHPADGTCSLVLLLAQPAGGSNPGSPASAMVELTEIDTTVASDDADLGAGLSLGSSSRGGLESIESGSDAGGDQAPGVPPPLPPRRAGSSGARGSSSSAKGAALAAGRGSGAAGLAAAQQLLRQQLLRQQQQKWGGAAGRAGSARAEEEEAPQLPTRADRVLSVASGSSGGTAHSDALPF